ncbi:MAG TPA: universal stress protein [Candidatus Dormibacteraeota bacterium]|nr:universal stress protein [Candidatus Dormibacteraeota bacterium]
MVLRKEVPGPFHEIVVPTDCSSGSARALEFALALAGHGSGVTAVHAVDSLQYRFGPRESSRARKQQVWALAQESVCRWLQENKLSGCDAMVVEGEAAPAITAFAAARGADLVVLATSARRSAARLLLGSVAEEVFRMVNCPVFVLGTKAAAAKKKKPSRLVFATDLEPHSLGVLSQLSKIGTKLGAGISVIRAVHPDITSRTERSRIREETRQKVEAAADSALRKRIRKVHVEFAHPVKAIVGFANRLKADAIVMGIRSGGGLTRASTHIPWALAHRVINEAACPVLTIRR